MKKLGKPIFLWLAVLVGASLALAGIDGHAFWRGWFAYAITGLVLSGLVLLSWRWIRIANPPGWLRAALLIAIVLRLGLGVGLTLGLPSFGYPDSEPHQAGYIYLDAYNRDGDAWALAESGTSIFSALQDPSISDQYGGLLFISSGMYKLLSPDAHRPILLLTLTSGIGALAVLFTWAFTRQAFGDRSAKVAAWLVALYPEAVLLSSSQMREPFLITSFALALAGYGWLRRRDVRRGIEGLLIAFAVAVMFSPPYALLMLGIVGIAWVWESRRFQVRKPWLLVLLAVLAIGAFALTLRAWAALQGGPQGSFSELIRWWIGSGAEYQLYLLERQSGWVQKIFEQTPEWSHMLLATVYGLVQPFLPAALMDSGSAPAVRILVSWRGLGWFFLLPFLLYTPIAAVRAEGWRGLPSYLTLVFWATAILASYRNAGQMWDNPRWRAVFLGLQAALAGWAWVRARDLRSPWLRAAGVVVGVATLGFLQWEAGRYYQIPRLNIWETLLAILIFTALFLGSTLWFHVRRRAKA